MLALCTLWWNSSMKSQTGVTHQAGTSNQDLLASAFILAQEHGQNTCLNTRLPYINVKQSLLKLKAFLFSTGPWWWFIHWPRDCSRNFDPFKPPPLQGWRQHPPHCEQPSGFYHSIWEREILFVLQWCRSVNSTLSHFCKSQPSSLFSQ